MFDGDFNFIHVEGLGQIIGSTEFHGPDSGFRSIIGGQHHDLGVDLFGPDVLKNIKPAAFLV